MKKKLLCLLFLAIFLSSCSANNKASNEKPKAQSNNSIEVATGSGEKDKSSKSSDNTKASTNNKAASNNTSAVNNISEKVKNYILNGQGDKPEAQKLNWSKSFLEKADMNSLYEKYKAKGGNSNDVKAFAEFITLNAPEPSNWQELAKKDIADAYGQTISRFEHISGDQYRAYIKVDGVEKPFVSVSARTGYFHG